MAYVEVSLTGLSKNALVASGGTTFASLAWPIPSRRFPRIASGGWYVEVTLTGLSKNALVRQAGLLQPWFDWTIAGSGSCIWTAFVLGWQADGTSRTEWTITPPVSTAWWWLDGEGSCEWIPGWNWFSAGEGFCEWDAGNAEVVGTGVYWFVDGKGSCLWWNRNWKPVSLYCVSGDGEYTGPLAGGGGGGGAGAGKNKIY